MTSRAAPERILTPNMEHSSEDMHIWYPVIAVFLGVIIMGIIDFAYSNILFDSDYYYGNGKFENAGEFCRRMKSIVDWEKITLNCVTGRCIQVYRTGDFRFGNDLQALRKSINLADFMGIKEIHLSEGYNTFTKSFQLRDINVQVMTKKQIKRQEKRCYTFWPFDAPLPGVNLTHGESAEPGLKDAFNNELKDYLVDMPDDVLVMHVRSGDIFGSGYIHPMYGQPPCAYYQSVMNERNWSKVLLFAEDTLNPCVNVLKKAGAQHIQRDLKQEIALMMSTKNLILGRGSFGVSLAWLSKSLKNLWTFASGLVVNGVQQKECRPTREYSENVLKSWQNTKGQLEWMLNSSCKSWQIVETTL